ncbi:MAG: helix-turn-helix domain-containing protein [Acidobacteriota bacterium]
MESKDSLLTPEEAAGFLRLSVAALYAAHQRRQLPSIKIGRRLRFRRSDLERLIDARTQPPLEPPAPSGRG